MTSARAAVTYTQLCTQRPRWPRQPSKRLINRADLIQWLQDNPALNERLRTLAEERLHPRLDEIYAEPQVTVDAYQDFDEQD